MNDIELPASTESGTAALRAGSLSMPKVLGMGAAFLAPGVILITNPAYLGLVTGRQSWLAVLVDVPVFACLVAVIAVFARRFVVTGSLMSYVGEAFGAKSRIFTGSPLIIGYLVCMPSTAIFALTFAQGLLLDLHQSWGSNASSQVLVIAVLSVLAGYISYRGVVVSARFAIFCTLVCAPFVLILIVAAVIHSRGQFTNQFNLSGLKFSDLVSGLVLVFVGLVGFEGFTALGKETKDPVRNTVRILPILVGLVVVVLLVGCVTLLPLLLQHMDQVNAGQSPSSIVADAAGVGWVKIPLDCTLLLGTFSCLMAVFNDAARVTSTAGRDGMLPGYLGHISPKTGTPARALAAMGIIAVGIPAVSQFAVRQSPLQTSTALGPTQVYLWLIPYCAMCVGVLVLNRKEDRLWSGMSAVAALAFVVLVFVLVYSITHATGVIQVSAPLITLGLAAVLFLVSLWRHQADLRRGNVVSVAADDATAPTAAS
jgi:amino acid transporter